MKALKLNRFSLWKWNKRSKQHWNWELTQILLSHLNFEITPRRAKKKKFPKKMKCLPPIARLIHWKFCFEVSWELRPTLEISRKSRWTSFKNWFSFLLTHFDFSENLFTKGQLTAWGKKAEKLRKMHEKEEDFLDNKEWVRLSKKGKRRQNLLPSWPPSSYLKTKQGVIYCSNSLLTLKKGLAEKNFSWLSCRRLISSTSNFEILGEKFRFTTWIEHLPIL